MTQPSLFPGKTTKRRQPVRQPSVDECLEYAARALARPAERPHIIRAEPTGQLVARFVVPLDWCPTLNALAEMPAWKRQEVKRSALTRMMAQRGLGRRREPLPGRPLIRAIRFSATECDEHNGWTKIPVDRLTGKHGGLNFLVDDKPTRLQLCPWWEPAPRGQGFCYFEIWSGDETAEAPKRRRKAA